MACTLALELLAGCSSGNTEPSGLQDMGANAQLSGETVDGESPVPVETVMPESTPESTPSPTPEPTPTPVPEITLVMVGDILLHTPVAESGKTD